MQEEDLSFEDQMSIQDYDNDPRYQHLRKADFGSKWTERFNKLPEVTFLPKQEPKEQTLSEFISRTTERIKGKRAPEDLGIDLNAMATAFQKIGLRYDPDFNYREKRALYRALILWAISHKDSNFDLNKGLFLYGPVGTGKTLALQILSHILESNQFRDLHFTMRKADDIVDQVMSTGKFVEIKQMAYSHLFVDEVGQERININYFGNELCVMEKLIMYAYDSFRTNRTFLHISTNYTPDKFEHLYGSRVYSRMQEMFNFIQVDGNDFRSFK